MKFKIQKVYRMLGRLSVASLTIASAVADEPTPPPTATAPATESSASQPATRHGLFNALDDRSFYNEGNFPEPFLVDDSGLEINEARLDWTRTHADGVRSDGVKAEVEKGFGLLTVELEIPYVWQTQDGHTVHGFDNLDLGARYPLYQLVSAKGFFDTTFGTAVEAGIPVDGAISRNAELVPKIFNDTRLGQHFTMQSIFGYSMLFGGGDEGGRRTFEYGFDFGWTIQHLELPVPGVQQIIPMFELVGETGLNNGESGRNSVLGNAGFRVNLRSIGQVQPRIGAGYLFPMDTNARGGVHSGVTVSLVFEY